MQWAARRRLRFEARSSHYGNDEESEPEPWPAGRAPAVVTEQTARALEAGPHRASALAWVLIAKVAEVLISIFLESQRPRDWVPVIDTGVSTYG